MTEPAEQPELRMTVLGSDDLDAVWVLHQLALQTSTAGHLAERPKAEIENAISGNGKTASVAAWVGDMLVGYSLCSAAEPNELWNGDFFRRITRKNERVWVGSGTVVRPEFQGKHLMRKLLAARAEEISRQAPFHTAGLIATDNLPSLANAMRAGGWVVGLHHDEYCLNYILYSGLEKDRVQLGKSEDCALDDEAEIRVKLDEGCVGTELVKSTSLDQRCLRFRALESSVG